MWRLIKFLLIVAALAGLALVAYGYLGPHFDPDFQPRQREIRQEVDLGLDQ